MTYSTWKEECTFLSTSDLKGIRLLSLTGKHVPHAIAARHEFLIAAELDVIHEISSRVYECWSTFAEAYADLNEEVDGLQNGTLNGYLQDALRVSSELSNVLVTFIGISNPAQVATDIRTCLREGSGPLLCQFGGISVPWHLVYVGNKNLKDMDDFDPYAEAQQLLGIRRMLVFHVSADFSGMEEPTSTAKEVLISVGRDLPKFTSATAAADHLATLVQKSQPSAIIKRLHSKQEHDQQFRIGSRRPYDLWIILSHGGDDVGDFGQRTVDLRSGDPLKSSDFARYASPPFALPNSAGVIMLTCGAGILSNRWDLPIRLLAMGASAVIAPHAKVSSARSLALLEGILGAFANSSATPTQSFQASRKELQTDLERLHANLYAPLITTDLLFQRLEPDTKDREVAQAQ